MISKKTCEISIIIPCFNEQDNVAELAKRAVNILRGKKLEGEIIFINDGSTDDTQKILDQLVKKYSNTFTINNRINQGIATSWKNGIQKSKGKYSCLIDADLQNQPEDIYRLYREIKWTNVDLVQGWRSHIGRQKSIRYFFSITLNFLLNFLFKMNSHDNKSGFIIARKEVLEDILNVKHKYKYFQTFITVATKAKGYSIREIETLFEDRLMGKSFISNIPLKVVLFSVLDIFKAFFEYRFKDDYDSLLHYYAQKVTVQKKYQKNLFKKILYFFYQHTMFLHHWHINSNSFKYYADLTKTQWLKQNELEELQFTKLKRIINQAYYHVPYYREIFDKLKIHPEQIKSLSDITKLPYLTKENIRKNLFFSLFSDNYNKKNIQRITTSGSTGEPLVLFVDKEQLNLRFASTLRGMDWSGYQFGDKQVRLWHQTIGMNKAQVIKEKLDALLCRRMFIPAYEMKTGNLKKLINKIASYNPKLIDGYAESFNMIASFLKTNKVKNLHPAEIITSAQTLSQKSREIIEKELNTKVYDKYGSREFSGIAFQCKERKDHHVNSESYLVEIIKNNRSAKPSEIGEIVITDLTNTCVPLIRYRLGDLAEAVDNSYKCACGRWLYRIGEIKGRTQAIIIGKDGQLLPGTFFAHLIKDYWYAIKQFQVVQEKIGEIDLKVIKGGRFSNKILETIILEIKKYLGDDLIINIHFVENIPLGKTGKHYHSISRLNIDFQKMDKFI